MVSRHSGFLYCCMPGMEQSCGCRPAVAANVACTRGIPDTVHKHILYCITRYKLTECTAAQLTEHQNCDSQWGPTTNYVCYVSAQSSRTLCGLTRHTHIHKSEHSISLRHRSMRRHLTCTTKVLGQHGHSPHLDGNPLTDVQLLPPAV